MKIGFLAMLTLIFVTLKLANVVSWSWWLVLLPMYGGVFLFIAFVILGVSLKIWSEG